MDKKIMLGAVVAIGALALVPGLAVAVKRASEPLRRAAVRSGAVAWDEFRKAGAEVFEHVEDIAAEFRANVAAHQAETAASEVATATNSASGSDAS